MLASAAALLKFCKFTRAKEAPDSDSLTVSQSFLFPRTFIAVAAWQGKLLLQVDSRELELELVAVSSAVAASLFLQRFLEVGPVVWHVIKLCIGLAQRTAAAACGAADFFRMWLSRIRANPIRNRRLCGARRHHCGLESVRCVFCQYASGKRERTFIFEDDSVPVHAFPRCLSRGTL